MQPPILTSLQSWQSAAAEHRSVRALDGRLASIAAAGAATMQAAVLTETASGATSERGVAVKSEAFVTEFRANLAGRDV